MKVANRITLYAEGLAAAFAATIAFTIWLSGGPLWQVFSMQYPVLGVSYASLIGAPMLVASALLILVCFTEWRWGRYWLEAKIFFVAWIRMVLNIALTLASTAVVVALIQQGAIWVAPAVTLQCFVLMAAFAFATFASRRLTVALDPTIPTERLRQQLARTW
jgi:hypothetical protein